ncbi:MAG: thiamine pyrophosphate-binding protein [Bacillota bacterium]
MQIQVLDKLFENLRSITSIDDIAYHEVRNSRLNPVHKTNTDVLGVELWKKTHAQNPVYIDKTPILKCIMKDKRPIAISNTVNDSRSADEFFHFGIDSILNLPVVVNDKVEGLVVVASIGKLHQFTDTEISICENIVNSYTRQLFSGNHKAGEINNAKAMVQYLKRHSVDFIFGIPAGTISPIFDAFNEVDIKPVIAKNECGAAYMASRYACVSGKLGVCIGAGGVGAANMINGIADAKRSKAPVLAITGYVNRWQIGKGAIQELDTQNIFKPVTKHSITVLNEDEVILQLQNAIEIAMTPPRGPVHISIPVDVQLAKYSHELPDTVQAKSSSFLNMKVLNRAVEIINNTEDGIIMVGKGCRSLSEQVMTLSEQLQWPIITTPGGKGIVYSDFPLNLGNYGFAGTDAATSYVDNSTASCILALGTSLGEASTRNFNASLVKGRKLIHVDWDESTLNRVFKADVKIHADLKIVLNEIIKNTKKATKKFNKHELNEPYLKNHTGLSTRLFLEKITDVLPSNTYYVSDMGEYMNFVFKYLRIPKGGDFETSLNYAAMGSGIAGGIGVALAQEDKKRPVAIFAGDGSFFMHGTEIFTAKEYSIPIIYIIFNNSMLGYVNRGHQYLFGRTLKEFKQEKISISNMLKVAGIKTFAVNEIEDMSSIPPLVHELNEPFVIEVNIDGSEPAPILDRINALKKS